ncbi:hydroxysteroid dehydrogenase-like protein 2 [Antedon mediterranea]|uniref:hydroxysteroid dehydrogenase-like protein 2 n=1 Tax=Antedon mediterranea TaxID=105859 RepID=UPI003AF600C9
MLNTGKLAGRTLFITGASRGIGKAIALKAAKDGANIVIAAKTAQAHPKLPGTIYTAAEEIEKAGGKCLPCIVDIREEIQIQNAVDETVKMFGGIDIVVNNASAISLTGTQETSMKKYDLMHNVNTRGTYLTSKLCLPYLKNSKNPHILNISPPLNMNRKWFKNHVAYTMAKYGMSMCVLGMADELQDDNIAVNALWPRTAIWTAAMDMLGGGTGETRKQCRNVDIMADAAYTILTKDSKSYTGNFAIDDEVLQSVGVTDIDKYACEPGHTLLPDFFLEEAGSPEDMKDQLEKHGSQPAFGGGKASSPSAAEAIKLMDTLKSIMSEEHVKKMGAAIQFELKDIDESNWYLDMRSGSGTVGKGELEGGADVKMSMKVDDFVKMFKGSLKPTTAFMMGKLKIKGDMGKAMKLEKLMGDLQSKL